MAPNLNLGLELDLGPLQVAVLSPDRLVQRAVTRLIEARNDIRVTDDVHRSQVVLWDVAAEKLPQGNLEAPILALVSSEEEVRYAREQGITSAIDRGADGSSMIAALIAVRYGLSVSDLQYSPAVGSLLVDEVEPLTDREQEVLELLAAGLSNREIAPMMGVTAHTIKFHLSSIFSKLEVGSRTEAVVEGVRRGLISL